MLRFAAPLCAVLLPCAIASAGPLAPTKPSQLVTAHAASTPCPLDTSPLNNGFQISEMSSADGVPAPFAVPAKHVLVVTSVNLVVTGAPANETAQLTLFAVNAASGSILAQGYAATDANGFATVAQVLPSGISVKSGVPLCIVGNIGSTLGSVTGYFAKDK